MNEQVFLSGNHLLLESEEENTLLIRIYNVYNEQYQPINIHDYTRGWLIGDFQPSIKQTNEFEIGILKHTKNEKWGFHYHQKSIEFNLLIQGKMIINEKSIEEKDFFVFYPNDISCPLFLEDCIILCIKIPSHPNDKYLI
jgi:hypothetical protein